MQTTGDPYIAGSPNDETVAPLYFVAADGPILITAEGRRVLDWASTLNAPLGHGIRIDTANLPANAGNYRTTTRDAIVHRLATVYPFLSGFQLRSSGTESVEAALRYTKAAFTEPLQIVSIEGCYHGLTLGAQQLMGLEPAKGYSVLRWNDVVAVDGARAHLTRLLSSGPIAVWLEGVQGGTLRRLPQPFVEMLSGVQADHPGRVVVVVDDMLASLRCGSWCSVDAVTPDVVIGGKSWSSGYPFSFFGVAPWIRRAAGDILGTTTYGGNPIACAYADHTIERIVALDILGHVRALESRYLGPFTACMKASGIADPAWHGLLFGFTTPSIATAARIASWAADADLLLTQLGPVIRCTPPLNVPEALIDQGLEVLQAAVQDAAHT